jgi:hypothetical protein
MAQDKEPWWIEFENGERSTGYASEAEAWAALMDLQTPQAQMSLSYSYSRPAWLVSSRDLRLQSL